MNNKELTKILNDHKKWLEGKGGEEADLRGADLRGANLREANLWGADLRGADLRGADLRGANLWRANLRRANLRGADLRGANLREANLWEADLTNAYLPPVTNLLQCWWGRVSDKLILELMRYDASLHPRPEEFNKWAEGGQCPYKPKDFQQPTCFEPNRGLWKNGKTKSARELVLMLFKECGVKHSPNI